MNNEIRNEPVSYATWGEQNIEPGAREQMRRAAQLPIAVQGALMPDAHEGYGLPIGGVLATKNALIPYAGGRGYCLPYAHGLFSMSHRMFWSKNATDSVKRWKITPFWVSAERGQRPMSILC